MYVFYIVCSFTVNIRPGASMLVFLSGANKLVMGVWLEESVATPSM